MADAIAKDTKSLLVDGASSDEQREADVVGKSVEEQSDTPVDDEEEKCLKPAARNDPPTDASSQCLEQEAAAGSEATSNAEGIVKPGLKPPPYASAPGAGTENKPAPELSLYEQDKRDKKRRLNRITAQRKRKRQREELQQLQDTQLRLSLLNRRLSDVNEAIRRTIVIVRQRQEAIMQGLPLPQEPQMLQSENELLRAVLGRFAELLPSSFGFVLPPSSSAQQGRNSQGRTASNLDDTGNPWLVSNSSILQLGGQESQQRAQPWIQGQRPQVPLSPQAPQQSRSGEVQSLVQRLQQQSFAHRPFFPSEQRHEYEQEQLRLYSSGRQLSNGRNETEAREEALRGAYLQQLRSSSLYSEVSHFLSGPLGQGQASFVQGQRRQQQQQGQIYASCGGSNSNVGQPAPRQLPHLTNVAGIDNVQLQQQRAALSGVFASLPQVVNPQNPLALAISIIQQNNATANAPNHLAAALQIVGMSQQNISTHSSAAARAPGASTQPETRSERSTLPVHQQQLLQQQQSQMNQFSSQLGNAILQQMAQQIASASNQEQSSAAPPDGTDGDQNDS